MAQLSRRRFIELATAAGAQGKALASQTLGFAAGALLVGCRSLRDAFVRPRRLVIPSTAGDFVIDTADDPFKVLDLPLVIRAQRFQFPAVAATFLESPLDHDPGELDSDQVELVNVWVRLDAARGTRLFREHNVVRSDVLRAEPRGNFTLSVSPHHLMPEICEAVPLTLDIRHRPRWTEWAATRDVDQLLHFDFCVRPEICQAGGSVDSTLPTVVARWPRELDLVATPLGAPPGNLLRLPRQPVLRVTRGGLADCGGPQRELRWVEVRYDLPQTLELLVRRHADGRETSLRVEPGELVVRLRPGFVDLLIPGGSQLRSRGYEPVPLVHSHLHAANRYAFAWISDMPAETTTLPAELYSAFCLAAESNLPWPLAPDPIDFPVNGSQVAFATAGVNVLRSRAALTQVKLGPGISRSLEQGFAALTLTFEPAYSELQPGLVLTAPPGKELAHAVFDDSGRIVAGRADATSSLLLVVDMFMRVAATADRDEALDLRFREVDGRCLATTASLEFATREIGWAGRQARHVAVDDWVHLRQLTPTPTDMDYRGPLYSLAENAVIAWDMASDRFRVVATPSTIAASADEIVSLAQEAFRAALPSEFPRTKSTVWLPPFALREHRDLGDSADCSKAPPPFRWTDPNLPAFHSLTMWEPRTQGRVEQAPDSPSALFSAFTEAEGGATLDWTVYAGFAFAGSLAPLRDRDWAPDTRCHAAVLAPYRAVAAKGIQPVFDAIDVTDLCNVDYRRCYATAFDAKKDPQRRESLQRVARASLTEIAMSPVGGTIAYDWANERRQIGLNELVLHGWLGRYQKNFAIFGDLLLPYGLRINVLNLTARQDNGRLRYCTKWWFAEPSKTYGDNRAIVADNLRPINAVNYNPNEPLQFKADIHFRSGADEWVDRDRTLQGIGLITARNRPELAQPHLEQTVTLARPQALTLFRDTPVRLAHVVWLADPQTTPATKADPCVPIPLCAAGSPRITVTARGEIEEVTGMSYDNRGLEAIFRRDLDPDTGTWCEAGGEAVGDQLPVYASRSLTLGDGVVRVDRPLRRQDTFELNAGAEHTLRKTIRIGDVGLMQLVLGSDDPAFLENEGTLTIHEKLSIHDRQEHQDAASTREAKSEAEVDATLDFPEFSKGVGEVCAGALSFRLKVAPRSFRASFKKTLAEAPQYDAVLVADIGVPGLLVLKGCELRSRSGQSVAFTPGSLQPCGELLKKVFELLLEKLKGLLPDSSGGGGGNGGGGGGRSKSPFQLDLLSDPFGFLASLKLALPRIPFGTGSLENLVFDFRLALAIDVSKSGIDSGSLFSFILGDYPVKGFGALRWLSLPIEDVARGIFKQLRPPTLTVTPFTVRFSTVITVRVKPPRTHDLTLPDPFKSVCFDAAVCISGEGGLALAFDIGVANGTVSITVGIVWCPHASYEFNFTPGAAKEDEHFSFDEVALVARLELKASVLGVVNIFVRVEAMAQLKLTCKESILTHLEVSGMASIEVLFATVDVAFTVNLDPLLGINPDACRRDKVGSHECAFLDAGDVTRAALADFFAVAEVAA
jgi:hypothetical protein